MRNILCIIAFAILAAVVCAGVPDRNEEDSNVERVRRSINPWYFFNKKKDTKKNTKDKKKKAKTKPKPTTTMAPTVTTAQIITTTPTTSLLLDKSEMPEHVSEEMGKMKNISQIEKYLGITITMSQRIAAAKRTVVAGQSDGLGLSSNDWAYSTDCMPRPEVIRYKQPALYRGVLWPYCGIAYRCGGCCYVSMHQCVPDQVKTVFHPAYFVTWPSSSASQSTLTQPSKRKLRKKRSSQQLTQINVENHTSCKCQCKVTAEQCNSERQFHKESTCQCKCKDAYTSERLKCKEPFRYNEETCSCKCAYQHKHCPVAKQRWDNEKCKCICDRGIKCPKGQKINKTCECEDVAMSDVFKFYFNKVIKCKKSNTC